MKTAPTPDQELQRRVLDALSCADDVDAVDLGVTVRDGAVRLTGVLRSRSARTAAERATHFVPGVRDVANDIELHSSLDRGDVCDIALAVRRTLDAAPVDAHRISTTVSAGVVMLEGIVETAGERDKAEAAVRELAGVRRIDNRLTVRDRAEASTTPLDRAERRLDQLACLRAAERGEQPS